MRDNNTLIIAVSYQDWETRPQDILRLDSLGEAGQRPGVLLTRLVRAPSLRIPLGHDLG